jgi:hypothetical protein
MLSFKSVAGDFRKDGKHQFIASKKQFSFQKEGMWPRFETIDINQVLDFEKATEESVKKVWGTVAGGALGAIALGPLGLLAGVLVGGNRKEVVFICKFKDGRKLMAKCKSKSYKAIPESMF